jgi:hypothetical protein
MSEIKTPFQLRDLLLISLDHLLQKHDFKRSKHDFVWKKKIDREHMYQIHLNFGTYSDSLLINPVFEVSHASVEKILRETGAISPTSSNTRATVGYYFKRTINKDYEYTLTTDPKKIADELYTDFTLHGFKLFELLSDKQWIIAHPDEAGIYFSYTARLIPCVYYILKEKSKVEQSLQWYEEKLRGIDQMIPVYNEFRRNLEKIMNKNE